MVFKNLNEAEKGKTFLFLVRHGHFDLTYEKHKFDHNYFGLSKRGINQAKQVAKKFAKIKDEIDVFYSSSMRRARETAVEIQRSIKNKPKLSDNLWEFNQSLFTKSWYNYRFWKNYFKYLLRMRELNKILRQNRGKVILVVAHGNLIKGFMSNKMCIPKSKMKMINYQNCNISLLRFDGTKLDFVYYFNSKDLIPIRKVTPK